MGQKRALPLALLVSASVASAQVPPIDLNNWTTEQINGVAPWAIRAARRSCNATNQTNTDCSVLHSDFVMPLGVDFEFRMTIDPAGGDDDVCGFMIGWAPGDASNPAPDYLLVDWKKTTQAYQNWGTAIEGLALSRVTAPFTRGSGGGPIDLWSHTGGCAELARGNNFGGVGWIHATDYHFRVLFTASSLDVWVNGALEFHLTGAFNTSGRFACYQFSQHLTSYQFPVTASFGVFGTGCRGSVGTPYLFSPAEPYVGTDFPIVVANVPPTAVTLLVIGGSNTVWNGVALPLVLTGFGAPGCSLYVSGDVFLPATNYNGTVFVNLPIARTLPPGIRFFVQGLAVDLAANPLGVVFANAGAATIGTR